ncbi:leucyl/phenylalanyl-tRNA--protein transferase [Allocatelliglobosispora scoriae]|uniref:Leucyl/phenylalanyl-tRNA--protein transferase n=1 Tax=Allocatelliglobosispora scoriae TaxID=643052 RepID=A0A841BIR2_9ACTN|nr:leucyl/phenylalanyl-tRNA--protein transferase [Allocatelliglobosispora scoriae]MBB5867086.1 leucyl/phenylalanyl-tRNA--protein transferase [Allocatelliglobosispora scoriae]
MTGTCTEMAWESVDLTGATADLPVAVGGSVAPHRLLEAYRHGAFPYPSSGDYAAEVNRALYGDHVEDGVITAFPGTDPYAVTWWNPPQRPVIPAGGLHLSRNLRRDLRNRHPWTTTCDHAFTEVVQECRRHRSSRWLTDELCDSLLALYDAGWAHSVEVWHGDELIGGLFGTGMGRVHGVDSAFTRVPDAGKVAFADLAARLPGEALIDVQVTSDYTTALGARPIDRADYLAALRDVDLPLIPAMGVRFASALAG